MPRIAHVRTIGPPARNDASMAAAGESSAAAGESRVGGRRVRSAGPQRQQRGGAVLGLDPDELPDDLGRRGRGCVREALGAEAVAADRVGRQAARSSPSPRAGSRRETTLETPLPAIETP